MKLLLVALASLTLFTAVAQPANRRQQYNVDKNGLALEGYDPVSYFTGKPQQGEKKFAVVDKGVTYWFTSDEHRKQFLADASAYEPQYGGWCAYAMGSSGEKVEIDPDTYKIVSGKLYLFYNKFFNNTLKSWNKDEARLKASADKNWEKYSK